MVSSPDYTRFSQVKDKLRNVGDITQIPIGGTISINSICNDSFIRNRSNGYEMYSGVSISADRIRAEASISNSTRIKFNKTISKHKLNKEGKIEKEKINNIIPKTTKFLKKGWYI